MSDNNGSRDLYSPHTSDQGEDERYGGRGRAFAPEHVNTRLVSTWTPLAGPSNPMRGGQELLERYVLANSTFTDLHESAVMGLDYMPGVERG